MTSRRKIYYDTNTITRVLLVTSSSMFIGLSSCDNNKNSNNTISSIYHRKKESTQHNDDNSKSVPDCNSSNTRGNNQQQKSDSTFDLKDLSWYLRFQATTEAWFPQLCNNPYQQLFPSYLSSSLLLSSLIKDNDSNHHYVRTSACTGSPSILATSNSYDHDYIQEYDFVIVGYGNAGRSVVNTIHTLCPNASIAVIDPQMSQNTQQQQQQQQKSNTNNKKIHFLSGHAVNGLNPQNRQIQVVNIKHVDNDENPIVLKYRYSICIATGSHGAPIPDYLVDDRVRNEIYEIRSTTASIPSVNSNSTNNSLSPDNTRQRILVDAKNGYNIGILGSGWGAVDIAHSCIKQIKNQSYSTKEKGSVQMIYGTYGPLAHTVPTYLSAAISKRLKVKGIQICDRSLIRYISLIEEKVNKTGNVTCQRKLGIYTAKAHDFADGNRFFVDKIIVAPEISCVHGNASIPTVIVDTEYDTDPDNLIQYKAHTASGETVDNVKRVWYKTWSQLATSIDDNDIDNDIMNNNKNDNTATTKQQSKSSLLSCYNDDGRIAVNPELRACTDVYAVGSVAKYGNGLTGHACVAGNGIVDATFAGTVAGTNMSRTYLLFNNSQQNNSSSSTTGSIFGKTTNANDNVKIMNQIHVIDQIPIWRSDLQQYTSITNDSSTSNDDGNDSFQRRPETTLKELGINALCVGNCDAERLATHGVWWTNQSVQQRFLRTIEQQENTGLVNDADVDNNNNNNNDSMSSKQLSKHNKPIYGMGIVFYIDKTSGQIQGIMTWGMPYTISSTSQSLNQQLIATIKHILCDNGGFLGSLDDDYNYFRLQDLFTARAKDILLAALSGGVTSRGINVLGNAAGSKRDDNSSTMEDHMRTRQDESNVPKPLHRTSIARHVTQRNANILKRKDGQGSNGTNIHGDNLFSRTYYDEYFVQSFTHTIIKLTGNEVGTAGSQEVKKQINAMNQYTMFHLNELKFDINEGIARPPREDPLWIRRGDEKRSLTVSHQENMAYQAIIKKSQS